MPYESPAASIFRRSEVLTLQDQLTRVLPSILSAPLLKPDRRPQVVLAGDRVARPLLHGGQVVVRDGKVLAAFRMPILGLFSDQPYEEVLERRREIQAGAESLGCTLNDPLLKLEFSYACAEFPLLRMSEQGLFRTDTKEHLSVIAA